MPSTIWLALLLPGSTAPTPVLIGCLEVTGVEACADGPDGEPSLTLELQFRPPPQPPAGQVNGKSVPISFGLIDISGRVVTHQLPHREVGRVVVSDEGLPVMSVPHASYRWRWLVRPEDIEVAEHIAKTDARTPLRFTLQVRGLVKITTSPPADVLAVQGHGNFAIEPSQWERLLLQLGYRTPPSIQDLAFAATLDHPSWDSTSARLDSARRHHRAGEDYAALDEILEQLEALIHKPYDAHAWQRALQNLPSQKEEGIASMFAGLATYCNKIGHHRDRADRGPDGDLRAMPLDHWEAELALGAAQFLLTYAVRLRESGVLGTSTAATITTSPNAETSSADTVAELDQSS